MKKNYVKLIFYSNEEKDKPFQFHYLYFDEKGIKSRPITIPAEARNIKMIVVYHHIIDFKNKYGVKFEEGEDFIAVKYYDHDGNYINYEAVHLDGSGINVDNFNFDQNVKKICLEAFIYLEVDSDSEK